MKTKAFYYMFRVLSCVVLVAGLTGCPWDWETHTGSPHTETADLSQGGTLEVSNNVGVVSITGWNQAQVSVTYTKKVHLATRFGSEPANPAEYFSEIDVEVTENAAGVSVIATLPEVWSSRSHISGSVDLDIKVPNQLVLTLENNVGSVTVADVSGTLSLAVNVGNLELDDVTGDLTATVDVGDLSLERALALDATDSISATVNVGGMELELPSESAFDLDAEATLGDIDIDSAFGVTVEREGVVGARAAGAVNGGGATVELDVDVGDIELDVYEAPAS